MRQCPQCKVAVLDDEANFCIECGSKLETENQKSEVQSSISDKTSSQQNLSEKMTDVIKSAPINLDKKSEIINVIKGQKIKLNCQPKIEVILSWICDKNFDIDAAAFLLDSSGKVSSDENFIFYNNRKHSSGCAEHITVNNTCEKIKLNLENIPEDISKIAFTLTINDSEKNNQNFGLIQSINLKINDSTSSCLVYDLNNNLTVETAIVVAEIYRYKNEWKFNAIGAGFSGGLVALCKNFGVDVDTK